MLCAENEGLHQLQRTSSYLWPYIASVEPRSLYEPMKKFIAALIKTDSKPPAPWQGVACVP